MSAPEIVTARMICRATGLEERTVRSLMKTLPKVETHIRRTFVWRADVERALPGVKLDWDAS